MAEQQLHTGYTRGGLLVFGVPWVLALTQHTAHDSSSSFLTFPEGTGSAGTRESRPGQGNSGSWRSHGSDILMSLPSTGPWSGQFSRLVS